MLLLFSGYGIGSPPPAFAADFQSASVSQDDLGYHLRARDAGWKVAHTADRKNIKQSDASLNISQDFVGWNVKEG